MPQRRTGPLEVDQFCRRLGDQIQAAAALDDDVQCAAMLRTLAKYLEAKEIEIRQTAWDPDRAAPEPTTITAKFDGRCARCSGQIRVGQQIVYDSEARRASHPQCAGGAA